MPLRLTQLKVRDGRFGPERQGFDLRPNDEVVLSFAIEGLSTDAERNVRARLDFEVRDASSNVLLQSEEGIEHRLGLGGDFLTGSVQVGMSEETAPGEYTVAVKVVDEETGETADCEQVLRLLEPEWSIVRPRLYLDATRTIAAGTRLLAGQTLYFSLRVSGVNRLATHIESMLVVQVLEEAGKRQVAPDVSHLLESYDREVVSTAQTLDFEGEVPLNRPGSFVIRFVARDEGGGRVATHDIPIQVELA